MTMIPIIGIAGRARSGKDTVAGMLMSSARLYRYAFADPIREMLWAGFQIDTFSAAFDAVKDLPRPDLGGISPRRMMQTLGTEWGRHMVHADVWVLQAARVLRLNGPGMLVTDVRFENEAEWIRAADGLVVHVRRAAAAPVEAHASEAGVAVRERDIVIDNDGTLDDLRARVAVAFADVALVQ